MPRYLVTLRHAETGETTTVVAPGENAEDAMLCAEDQFEENWLHWYSKTRRRWVAIRNLWQADHACPAADEPVPFRDR